MDQGNGMTHSTGKPTKAQKQRLDRISRLPCMACVQNGTAQPFPTEVHHLVDKGYRSHSGGHDATIPLCWWHHRGCSQDGLTSFDMEAMYGPSLALSKRWFTDRYGTERDMLSRVNTVLGLQGIQA